MSRVIPCPPRPVVLVYCRVSTEAQGGDGLGVEAQRAACERWATGAGLEVADVFVDVCSGATPLERRPGLSSALRALTASKGAVLVVAARSRVARDTLLAALVGRAVQRAGGRLMSLDAPGEGAAADLLGSILDAVSQFERELIRSRTRAALAVKRDRGELVGGVPFGWRVGSDGVHLEPEPAEQAAIQRMQELRREGLSVRAIARTLAYEQVPARGKCWYATSVQRVLQRAP